MKKKNEYPENPNNFHGNAYNPNYGPHEYHCQENSTSNCQPQNIIPPGNSFTSSGNEALNSSKINHSNNEYLNQRNFYEVGNNQIEKEEVKGEHPRNPVEEEKVVFNESKHSNLLINESEKIASMNNPRSENENFILNNNSSTNERISKEVINNHPSELNVNRSNNLRNNGMAPIGQGINPSVSELINPNSEVTNQMQRFTTFEQNSKPNLPQNVNNTSSTVINNNYTINYYQNAIPSQNELQSQNQSQIPLNISKEPKEGIQKEKKHCQGSFQNQKEEKKANAKLALFYVKRMKDDLPVSYLCFKILPDGLKDQVRLYDSDSTRVNDAIQHKNRIYYCGGFINTKDNKGPLNYCLIVNLDNYKEILYHAFLTEPKWNVSLCTTAEILFCLGGAQGNGDPPAKILPTCEYYEEKTNKWLKANPMNEKNCCITSFAWKDSFLFSFGGFKSSKFEKYSITNDKWENITLKENFTKYQFKRSYGCTWHYSENEVLIFGGDDIPPFGKHFLIFDCLSNSIEPHGSFEKRYNFFGSKPVFDGNYLSVISFGTLDGDDRKSTSYHNRLFEIDLKTLKYIESQTNFGNEL